MMNRRNFFKLSVGGIATAAAVSREWPFRIFSFPKDIVIAKTADVDRAARRILDPIVSMALDGSNAYFFSGKVRRPTREEFEDYMGLKEFAIEKGLSDATSWHKMADASTIKEVRTKIVSTIKEVRTKIVEQYGASWRIAADLPVEEATERARKQMETFRRVTLEALQS